MAAASSMGNWEPSRMCHVNRKYTAEIAIAVTPHDAAMAAILYVDCSLQRTRSAEQHSLACSHTMRSGRATIPIYMRNTTLCQKGEGIMVACHCTLPELLAAEAIGL